MAQSVIGALIVFLIGASAARAQADGSRKWAFDLLSSSAAGNVVSSPAIAPDGTIYIGVEIGSSTSTTPAGRVHALRPDGTQKWTYSTGDWVDAAPAIGADGTVYVGCWDGKLHAIKPDGTARWAAPFVASGFIASSPAIGADGTLYFGAGKGDLHAVSSGGVLKWTFPAGDWVDSSPAIGPDGTIYFGSWDNAVYAVKPDGALRWRYVTGGDVVASPAIGADGTVYVGSRDLNLYAFSAAGALKWKAALGDTIEASPVLGPDGTVYAATTGGRLFALTLEGIERWRFPATGQTALGAIYSTPAVRADGSIVLGTSNNALLALRSDGTQLWRSAMDDWADSSPAVAPDGTIYIGCSDKRLYAFRGTSGPSMTDWPQFRRDSQRTGFQLVGSFSGTTGRLGNLSVRTRAGTGGDTLIAGFVVAGSGVRTLLVRGVGPTLAAFGVTGALADPSIALFSGSSLLAANDDWGQASNQGQVISTAAAVGAFPLPSGSRDAALLRDFGVGGYTVQVSGADGSSGIALMEAYDTGGGGVARLANLSARSAVGTGADILIAGFVVTGSTRAVLVRAIGPTLAIFGVEGVLADPRLQVYDGSGRLVAENDNWSSSSNAGAIASSAQAVGAFPLTAGSTDASLLLTLPSGSYTAQVAGINSTMGVGLVELYEVP